MVLAACSGMVAATFCHPLDVIRVQMQTEGTKFKSTIDAGLSIYKRAGLTNGIYAGISAAYLRQWLYGSFRIGVYSYQFEHAQIENERAGRSRNDISFVTKLRMGCVSGAIGSFVGTPSELVSMYLKKDAPTLRLCSLMVVSPTFPHPRMSSLTNNHGTNACTYE